MTSKAKRSRNLNFSSDEKDLIMEFVKENAVVLESKLAEPNLFKKKRKLWEDLSLKMRAAGYSRSPKKLRDTYFRMKQGAKTNISKFRKEQHKTGGGEGPSMPSETDWAIFNIASVDFEEDVSNFDSDAIQIKETPAISNAASPTKNDSYFGLIDPLTGEIIAEDECRQANSTSSPKPIPNPSCDCDVSPEKKKRKKTMTHFEEEMLRLNTKHIEARIANEKRINEKELEILEIKKEAENARLKIFKKILEDSNVVLDVPNI